jgi:hypothetical protein
MPVATVARVSGLLPEQLADVLSSLFLARLAFGLDQLWRDRFVDSVGHFAIGGFGIAC